MQKMSMQKFSTSTIHQISPWIMKAGMKQNLLSYTELMVSLGSVLHTKVRIGGFVDRNQIYAQGCNNWGHPHLRNILHLMTEVLPICNRICLPSVDPRMCMELKLCCPNLYYTSYQIGLRKIFLNICKHSISAAFFLPRMTLHNMLVI